MTNMKHLIIILVGVMMLGMVACGQGADKSRAAGGQAAAQVQPKRGFQLPEVPVMLSTPEQRREYLAQHYWDKFDFGDTAYIHLPDITEQAAVDFMDLLQRVPQDKALKALKNLAGKAAEVPRMMGYFWDVLYRYWYDPNSPMKNEGMFILLCQGVEQTPEVPGHLRERAAFLRTLAEKNRPGMVAPDFVYTLASGKTGRLHGLKAEFTLLFFYNPDCETCAEVKGRMRESARLKELVDSGRMKVLTLYPDEDVDLWKEHLHEMEDSWINGYDKGQVLTVEKRFDFASMPSFYLLDKDKRVVLKDADWQQVLPFFER